MTMLCTVMAWGTTVQVGTFEALQNAVDNAASGDIIKLTADIAYPETGDPLCLNILKSLTIDGQGHTLSGVGHWEGSTAKSSLLINRNGTETIDVTLKNINIVNSTEFRVVLVSASLSSLTIDNCEIRATSSANNQPITFQSKQTDIVDVTINNSIISAGASGYPVIIFEPIHLTTANTIYSGYCGLYFKGNVNGRAGARGSIVNATNCNFECPNVHSGNTNAFSCFPLEDDGITLNLHNCGMNIEQIGDQNQAFVTIGNISTARHENPINITLSGDNSHFNTKGGLNKCIQNLWIQNTMSNKVDLPLINVTIEGGTYSVNPIPTEEEYSAGQAGMLYYGQWKKDGDGNYTGSVILWGPDIPDTHEIQKINQGGVTLYRVVKKAQEKTPGVMYDLNDFVPVEGEDYGNNPVSSFDLSTGTDMTLNQETTTAGYVQVKDNADTSDPTIVTVGTPTEDQTLIINNGLDVQGESQVIVEAGSTLQIGEGGINTEKPANIVITANENGAASLLLDPTITVNQTPNLTVRMTAKQIGRNADGDFLWHRFAMPVAATITSWDKEGSLAGTTTYPTYIYAWDYSTNDWANLSGVEEMVPLQGYTLTLASNWINYDGETATDAETETGNLNVPQDVVYTFKGNLVGNTDQALNFQHEGFNFFGNSYTGYMSVLNLISGIESDKIEDVIYMWNADQQKYVGVSLYKLQSGKGLKNWQKEVAPMQTFIMRLRGADSANESVNYSSAIWGNPRYGNTGSGSGAPRRRVASINEDTYMEITVTAANGQSDVIDFAESASNTDAFENGYDVVKFMNEHTINLYTTLAGEEFSSVVTDNLEGKTLNLKTNSEISYTISFENVEGEEYALRDNATGAIIAIENGVTYEFAAQPNSTVEGRFEIISVAKMPTATENTEVKANAKGIYTIMGQYLGENFDILPAGVYVVNGVKIVK